MFGLDSRAAKYTFTAAVVLGLLYGLFVIRGVLFIVTVSIMLAYLLYPVVDLLNRYLPGPSRTPALVVVYLTLLGGITALVITLGSRAAVEATSLSEQAPALLQRLQQAPAPSTPFALQSLKENLLHAVQVYIYGHYKEMASSLPGFTLRVLKASTNLLYVIIIPILSFFILKDGRHLRDEFLDMLEPGSQRAFADDLLRDMHTMLLQYMRALFWLCSITLITFATVLSLLGVPDAILLACIAFPLEFIPLVGPLIAAVTILSVSILTGYPHLIWIAGFLGAYRLVQDYVISPRLMSEGVELHPVLVIFGVLAGGEIAGVEGTFLSVPVLALLRVVYTRVRKSRLTA